MNVTTKSGFKFKVDERIVTDWRVIEAMAMADNADNPEEMITGCRELVSLVFGDDKNRLIEHIKKKNDGFVPMDAIKSELLSVFEKVNSLKNSKSSPVS